MFPLEEGLYRRGWMRLITLKRRPKRKEGEAWGLAPKSPGP